MSTVLVTGITGQDGTLLSRRLAAEGHEVHGLALSDDEHLRTRLPPEAIVHVGDLGDVAQVRRLILDVAPSLVFNLGGQSSVAASWNDPVETMRATSLGACGVFEGALEHQEKTGSPVRVLQPSSAEIFGAAEQVPQVETTPIQPVSPYGVAKACAHHLARVYRHRGLFVSTVVLYNHESPLRPETFVTRKISMGVARIAVAGHGTLSLGNLDARRDWGWAEDYVDAMVRAIHHDHADDFVVASGESHSVGDFVAAAFAQVGIDDWRSYVVTDPGLVRPTEAGLQVGDASKARRELGWVPSVGFAEIPGRMVEHDIRVVREAAPA